MKKKLLALLLGAGMLALAACSSNEESNLNEVGDDPDVDPEDLVLETPAEEGVTEADLMNVREEHTIELPDGTVTFRLTNAYIGEAAEEQLAAMGEDADGFPLFEDGLRFVLLEYDVKADSGFEDTPFSGEDLLGFELWDADLTDTCPYYSVDLDTNADLNYTNVTLHAGEESTMYALYEMSDKIDAFVDCLTGKDQDYWFLYELEE